MTSAFVTRPTAPGLPTRRRALRGSMVLGRPASHARQLAVTWRARAVALFAAAVAVAAVGLGAPGAAFPQVVPGTGLYVTAGLVAAAVVAGRLCWDRGGRAAVGVRSERRVAKVLERVGAEAVVHGALLGAGGDCDHLVLGAGAVVVETKTGRGRVQVDRSGQVTVNGRRLRGNTVRQVLRQRDLFARVSGIPAREVLAVICVPDAATLPRHPDVVFANLDTLPRVLSAAPRVLGPDRARALAACAADGTWERRQRR